MCARESAGKRSRACLRGGRARLGSGLGFQGLGYGKGVRAEPCVHACTRTFVPACVHVHVWTACVSARMRARVHVFVKAGKQPSSPRDQSPTPPTTSSSFSTRRPGGRRNRRLRRRCHRLIRLRQRRAPPESTIRAAVNAYMHQRTSFCIV
eukprot:6020363-Pleurochrysis_carterae.AAC.2